MQRTGLPLGLSEDASWESRVAYLKPGALLLLYTDGIHDAQNPGGEFFGEERVLKLIHSRQQQTAQDIQEALLNEVYEFANGEPQVDDITLMVLSRQE